MHILDIDLDFFQDGIKFYPNQVVADPSKLKLWDANTIVDYIRHNCNVKCNDTINFFMEHKEVFYYLLANVNNDESIKITHIDAHSDLGYADTNYIRSDNYLSYIIQIFNVHILELVYSKHSVLDIPSDILATYSFLKNKRISIIKQKVFETKFFKKTVKILVYSQNEYTNMYKPDLICFSQSPLYTADNSYEVIEQIKKKMLTTAST